MTAVLAHYSETENIVSELENFLNRFQAAGKSLLSHAFGVCADYTIYRRPPCGGHIRGSAENASKTIAFEIR